MSGLVYTKEELLLARVRVPEALSMRVHAKQVMQKKGFLLSR
jgi:hypothetical protein